MFKYKKYHGDAMPIGVVYIAAPCVYLAILSDSYYDLDNHRYMLHVGYWDAPTHNIYSAYWYTTRIYKNGALYIKVGVLSYFVDWFNDVKNWEVLDKTGFAWNGLRTLPDKSKKTGYLEKDA